MLRRTNPIAMVRLGSNPMHSDLFLRFSEMLLYISLGVILTFKIVQVHTVESGYIEHGRKTKIGLI